MLTVSPKHQALLQMWGKHREDESFLVAPGDKYYFWSIGGAAVDPELAESLIKNYLVTPIGKSGMYRLSEKGSKTARVLIQYRLGKRV